MTYEKPPPAPQLPRCDWALGDPLNQRYHDEEWGLPVREGKQLFEMLILEGAQAGLSWITILKKRANYRKAFADFSPDRIARFGAKERETLLANPGIVRNRLKIDATITNAQAFLEVEKAPGGFSRFVWSFVDHTPRQNAWQTMADCPSTSAEALALSNALKKNGFRFVGPTICYAFMQAAGLVNDHLLSCFRFPIIKAQGLRHKSSASPPRF